MQKMSKQYYYTKNGERKVSSYKVYIPKKVAELVGITDKDKLKIYAEDEKIIIEKEN